MTIDRMDFATECVRFGLYCGVNPHYMLGAAQLRSEISDSNKDDEFGPFRLKQDEWNANCTDNEFDYNFLPVDIKEWDMQVPVFALMAHRAFDAFVAKNSRNPSAKELYLAQWPNAPTQTLSADFQKALDDTAALLGPATTTVLGDPQSTPPVISNPDQQPPPPPSGPFQLGSISPARQPIAQKILDAFAVAGFGKFQQAAALANAIAESNLDPKAHAAVGEDSWGLFQLNRNGGLGKGHNPDELIDPDRNIAIVLAEAKKYVEFSSAASLDVAVSAFVRDVERPKDPSGDIIKRLKIAQRLLPVNQFTAAGGAVGSAGEFASKTTSIAIQEWNFFGQQEYDASGHAVKVGHKEGEDGCYQRVGTYWAAGTGNPGIDGRDHDMPWSAAFISWMMKVAGAGSRFRYSTQHSVYISQAIRDKQNNQTGAGFWAWRLNEYKPVVGDIICWSREPGIDYDNQKGGVYKGHCDLVVQAEPKRIWVVGGNVGDSVTKRPIGLGAGGYLPSVNQGGETLFAIMQNLIVSSEVPIG